MYSYILIYLSYICQFFFICQDGYFNINAFYMKVFNNFCLPGVVSAVIVLFDKILLVVSICVLAAKDD